MSQEMSTTMVFVRLLIIIKDKILGNMLCLLCLMRQELLAWMNFLGSLRLQLEGQICPEDADKVMWYRESKGIAGRGN